MADEGADKAIDENFADLADDFCYYAHEKKYEGDEAEKKKKEKLDEVFLEL